MERLNSLNAKLLTSTWVRRSALIFSRNMSHRLKKGKWITNIYLVKWQHIYIREKNKRYPSYLWNLPSPDNLNHKFLRYRLKILAHNDVVVVCLTNNETKAEILWNNNKNKKRKRKLGRMFVCLIISSPFPPFCVHSLAIDQILGTLPCRGIPILGDPGAVSQFQDRELW